MSLLTEGIFSLGKSRVRGDLITVFQFLKGSYKVNRGSLSTKGDMEKTRDNHYNLLWEMFHLCIRNKFFTVRTTSP